MHKLSFDKEELLKLSNLKFQKPSGSDYKSTILNFQRKTSKKITYVIFKSEYTLSTENLYKKESKEREIKSESQPKRVPLKVLDYHHKPKVQTSS